MRRYAPTVADPTHGDGAGGSTRCRDRRKAQFTAHHRRNHARRGGTGAESTGLIPPQHIAVPPFVMAQLCAPPTEIAVNIESVCTCTRSLLDAIAMSPSNECRPGYPPPRQYTRPAGNQRAGERDTDGDVCEQQSAVHAQRSLATPKRLAPPAPAFATRCHRATGKEPG